MIKKEELVKIGQFNKAHGIKGELSFTFTNDSFDESECPFLLCEMEGIFVPFRLEEYRFKSDTTAFVKLAGIDSDEQAKSLVNQDVYFSKEYIRDSIEEDSFTWDYFIGYTLIDQKAGLIGLISEVDDSTLNTLFVVVREEMEWLIPATAEIVRDADHDRKTLYVELPEGLLEIN